MSTHGVPTMAWKQRAKGTLAGDLKALLASGRHSDVTITAGDSCLKLHRVVLAARSPVFAAMFRHKMKESSEGNVTISDVNEEVLCQLVQFIYMDRAPLLRRVAPELLVVADKYDVASLKQDCEQQMIKDLRVENAAASAVLAMDHSCTKLRVAAINFINSHHKEVMGTEGWQNAMRERTETTMEICRMLRVKSEVRADNAAERRRSLADDMMAVLKSAEGSDVTLQVGDARLELHRAVLAARSAVFADMKIKGRNLSHGRLSPKEARVLLCFIYGDRKPPPAAVTDKLLALSARFQLSCLKEHCERVLMRKISVDNVMSLAIVAVKYSCSTLKRASVNFIKNHIFQVMRTAGWRKAVCYHAEHMVEISKLVGEVACAKK